MIGVHVAKISHVLESPNKKRKNMLDAIKLDCSILNLKACQIFVQGPRSATMSKMDYNSIKEYCSEENISSYVHSSYISVGIFPVNTENIDDIKSIRAISSIVNQLKACDQLDALGLVIHLTKRTPKQVIETFKAIMPYIENFKTPIILEQPAKKPDGDLTYETPQKINKLTNMMVNEISYTNWGWCIDTCHLWSAGIQLNNKSITTKWLKDIKHPKKIFLFHINGGNKNIFNTGKDCHIIPFFNEDDIWNSDFKIIDDEKEFNLTHIKKSSIYTLTRFLKKHSIDSIMEINRGNIHDVTFAVETMNKLL